MSLTKKLTALVASAMIASAVNTNAQGTGIVGDWIYNPSTQHEYALTTPGSWFNARESANSAGGYLVSINNSAENQWIASTFTPNYMTMWIGASDELVEGQFKWESGEPFVFSNWMGGQYPNSPAYNYSTMNTLKGSQTYANNTFGAWQICDPSEAFTPGIAERNVVIPEPSTLLLAGLGLAGLAFRRMNK